jgi:hypothetical protein
VKRKILSPAETRPPITQPVAQHCTTELYRLIKAEEGRAIERERKRNGRQNEGKRKKEQEKNGDKECEEGMKDYVHAGTEELHFIFNILADILVRFSFILSSFHNLANLFSISFTFSTFSLSQIYLLGILVIFFVYPARLQLIPICLCDLFIWCLSKQLLTALVFPTLTDCVRASFILQQNETPQLTAYPFEMTPILM